LRVVDYSSILLLKQLPLKEAKQATHDSLTLHFLITC